MPRKRSKSHVGEPVKAEPAQLSVTASSEETPQVRRSQRQTRRSIRLLGEDAEAPSPVKAPSTLPPPREPSPAPVLTSAGRGRGRGRPRGITSGRGRRVSARRASTVIGTKDSDPQLGSPPSMASPQSMGSPPPMLTKFDQDDLPTKEIAVDTVTERLTEIDAASSPCSGVSEEFGVDLISATDSASLVYTTSEVTESNDLGTKDVIGKNASSEDSKVLHEIEGNGVAESIDLEEQDKGAIEATPVNDVTQKSKSTCDVITGGTETSDSNGDITTDDHNRECSPTPVASSQNGKHLVQDVTNSKQLDVLEEAEKDKCTVEGGIPVGIESLSIATSTTVVSSKLKPVMNGAVADEETDKSDEPARIDTISEKDDISKLAENSTEPITLDNSNSTTLNQEYSLKNENDAAIETTSDKEMEVDALNAIPDAVTETTQNSEKVNEVILETVVNEDVGNLVNEDLEKATENNVEKADNKQRENVVDDAHDKTIEEDHEKVVEDAHGQVVNEEQEKEVKDPNGKIVTEELEKIVEKSLPGAITAPTIAECVDSNIDDAMEVDGEDDKPIETAAKTTNIAENNCPTKLKENATICKSASTGNADVSRILLEDDFDAVDMDMSDSEDDESPLTTTTISAPVINATPAKDTRPNHAQNGIQNVSRAESVLPKKQHADCVPGPSKVPTVAQSSVSNSNAELLTPIQVAMQKARVIAARLGLPQAQVKAEDKKAIEKDKQETDKKVEDEKKNNNDLVPTKVNERTTGFMEKNVEVIEKKVAIVVDATEKPKEKSVEPAKQPAAPICPPFQEIESNIYMDEKVSKLGKKGKRVLESAMFCDCKHLGLKCSDSRCINREMMVECSQNCLPGCQNQRFAKREYASLFPFYTGPQKGWGLKAATTIKKNTFLIEYIGEVVTTEEFASRTKKYAKMAGHTHHYFFELGQKCIDATMKGNVSRFINHSCEPNAVCLKWVVPKTPRDVSRIGFFANRDIEPGEEVTFDYNFQAYGRSIQTCHCGAASCKGVIGEKRGGEGEEGDSAEEEEEEDMEIEDLEDEEDQLPGTAYERRKRERREFRALRKLDRMLGLKNPEDSDHEEAEDSQRNAISKPIRNKKHVEKLTSRLKDVYEVVHRDRYFDFISKQTGDTKLLMRRFGLYGVFKEWLVDPRKDRDSLDLKNRILGFMSCHGEGSDRDLGWSEELLEVVGALSNMEWPQDSIVEEIMNDVLKIVCAHAPDAAKRGVEDGELTTYQIVSHIREKARRLFETRERKLGFKIPKKQMKEVLTVRTDNLSSESNNSTPSSSFTRTSKRPAEERAHSPTPSKRRFRESQRWEKDERKNGGWRRDRNRDRSDYSWDAYDNRRYSRSPVRDRRETCSPPPPSGKPRPLMEMVPSTSHHGSDYYDHMGWNDYDDYEEPVRHSAMDHGPIELGPPPPPPPPPAAPYTMDPYQQYLSSSSWWHYQYQVQQMHAHGAYYPSGYLPTVGGVPPPPPPAEPAKPTLPKPDIAMFVDKNKYAKYYSLKEAENLLNKVLPTAIQALRQFVESKKLSEVREEMTPKDPTPPKEQEVIKREVSQELEKVKVLPPQKDSPAVEPLRDQGKTYNYLRATDQDGLVYYYHKVTQQAVWQLPPGEDFDPECPPAATLPPQPDSSVSDEEIVKPESKLPLEARMHGLVAEGALRADPVLPQTTEKVSVKPVMENSSGNHVGTAVTSKVDQTAVAVLQLPVHPLVDLPIHPLAQIASPLNTAVINEVTRVYVPEDRDAHLSLEVKEKKFKQEIAREVKPIIVGALEEVDADSQRKTWLVKQVVKEMFKRESEQPGFNFNFNEVSAKKVRKYAKGFMQRKCANGYQDLWKGYKA